MQTVSITRWARKASAMAADRKANAPFGDYETPDAATAACPTVINGSLDTSDGRQTGRYSRIPPISACGMTKANPSTAADPTNPHLYDVYRFVNPTASPVCFTFTLTYGATAVTEGGSDAASSEAGGDAVSSEDAADAVSVEASAGAPGSDAAADDGSVFVGPVRYMAAFSTFYPTDLFTGYLGDVGDKQTPPQTMGITVPAGGTIDVVVYAIDVAPAGVGAYTLSCSTQ